MDRFVRILATTVPAFFAREKPISRKAKPACMKKTSEAARITQMELIAEDISAGVGPAAPAVAGRPSTRTPARGSARLYMGGNARGAASTGLCPRGATSGPV